MNIIHRFLNLLKKNIHIPLCSATTDIIRIYLAKYQKNNKRSDDNPALFVSSRTYKKYEGKIRISINNTETIIRNSGNSLNISRAHPHKFRRTIATKAIDKGMPIDQVQLLLGHSKIDTTLHYAQFQQRNVMMSYHKFIC